MITVLRLLAVVLVDQRVEDLARRGLDGKILEDVGHAAKVRAWWGRGKELQEAGHRRGNRRDKRPADREPGIDCRRISSGAMSSSSAR